MNTWNQQFRIRAQSPLILLPALLAAGVAAGAALGSLYGPLFAISLLLGLEVRPPMWLPLLLLAGAGGAALAARPPRARPVERVPAALTSAAAAVLALDLTTLALYQIRPGARPVPFPGLLLGGLAAGLPFGLVLGAAIGLAAGLGTGVVAATCAPRFRPLDERLDAFRRTVALADAALLALAASAAMLARRDLVAFVYAFAHDSLAIAAVFALPALVGTAALWWVLDKVAAWYAWEARTAT